MAAAAAAAVAAGVLQAQAVPPLLLQRLLQCNP